MHCSPANGYSWSGSAVLKFAGAAGPFNHFLCPHQRRKRPGDVCHFFLYRRLVFLNSLNRVPIRQHFTGIGHLGIGFCFKSSYDFNDLVSIMSILRGEGGCPWDREQDHKTIRNG